MSEVGLRRSSAKSSNCKTPRRAACADALYNNDDLPLPPEVKRNATDRLEDFLRVDCVASTAWLAILQSSRERSPNVFWGPDRQPKASR